MELVHVIAAAAIGLYVGSWLNRQILREPGYRIRDPKDLPEGADRELLDELEPAPEVGHVPVLALVRPRRSRHRWLPLTEVVTAGLYALGVYRFGLGLEVIPVLVLVTGLVAMSFVDARVFRLPDRMMAPTLVVGFAAIGAAAAGVGEPSRIGGALIGGAAYFTLLFLIHVVSPRGMGFGDVKLAFVMGCFLGWSAGHHEPFSQMAAEVIALVLAAAMIGSVLGIVIGVGYATIRRSFSAVFPFGPSLATGCLAVVMWSAPG